MRLLLVEDEVDLADTLADGLRREGYLVDVARDGASALVKAGQSDVELIVLDRDLPGLSGDAVCRTLRAEHYPARILMLTAAAGLDDRIEGLDLGADDYLPKPFAYLELLARLRALARRGPVERAPVLAVGDLRLDPAGHRVWRGDVAIELSGKEFAMLEIFMRNPGQVLSRFTLLEHAWEGEYENRSNVVDVYVRMLRDKIDRPFGRASLETVRGVGYRLCDGT